MHARLRHVCNDKSLRSDDLVRWDIYSSGPPDNQIHWFSITNSSVIVLFLTVLVAMIMIRALRKDIQRYNAEVREFPLPSYSRNRRESFPSLPILETGERVSPVLLFSKSLFQILQFSVISGWTMFIVTSCPLVL